MQWIGEQLPASHAKPWPQSHPRAQRPCRALLHPIDAQPRSESRHSRLRAHHTGQSHMPGGHPSQYHLNSNRRHDHTRDSNQRPHDIVTLE